MTAAWEELCAECYEDEARLGTGALARKKGRDARRSPRHKVPPARSNCKLQIGNTVYAARVLDESSGGYGLLVACPDRPGVGQTVKMYSAAGLLPLRVVHVTDVARPQRVDFGEHNDSPCFRLGCSRQLQRSLLAWLRGK